MKESEAKTKWCPLARIATADRNGDNCSTVAPNRVVRGPGVTDMANCIGSACMAWQRVSDTEGYCGAFGLPPDMQVRITGE